MRDFTFWSPKELKKQEDLPAVTIISGFLGSGKTTLLNHLLQRLDCEKVALLVNDFGSINVDASLIKTSIQQLDGAIGGMIELTSGCICCSISNKMMDAVVELIETHDLTHIIIEATGVADPKSILDSFHSSNLLGMRGVDMARIANLITVVDAANVQDYLEPIEKRIKTRKSRIHLHQVDRRRPLAELIFDQIECADVVLLNKIDAVSKEALQWVEGAVRSLNPQSEIIRCQFGEVDTQSLMGVERFNVARTPSGSRWIKELNDNQDHLQSPNETSMSALPKFIFGSPAKQKTHQHGHQNEFGLKSFVYHSREPFDGVKLNRLLREGLKNVIRAKGFYWTVQHSDRLGFLSIAGNILRADYMDHWWIDKVRCGYLTYEELPDEIKTIWINDEVGDRRQEIVMIGVGLDVEYIRSAMDVCLVPVGERNVTSTEKPLSCL